MEEINSLVGHLPIAANALRIATSHPDTLGDVLAILRHYSNVKDSKVDTKEHHKADTPIEASADAHEGLIDTVPVVEIQTPLSCICPRGRFTIQFLEDSVHLISKKQERTIIERSNVNNVLSLYMDDRYAKKDAQLYLVALKEPILIGKTLKQVLGWTIPSKEKTLDVRFHRAASKEAINSKSNTLIHADTGAFDITSQSMVGSYVAPANQTLQRLLAATLKTPTAATQFISAIGEKSIKCYHKVNDGKLWPLSCGIAFGTKPLIFIPLNLMASLRIGRAGTNAGRSFDLEISTDDQKLYQFNMIEQDHLQAVEQYLQHCAAACAQLAAESSDSEKENSIAQPENTQEEAENDSDDDDSSFGERSENENNEDSDNEGDSDTDSDASSESSADSDDITLLQTSELDANELRTNCQKRILRSKRTMNTEANTVSGTHVSDNHTFKNRSMQDNDATDVSSSEDDLPINLHEFDDDGHLSKPALEAPIDPIERKKARITDVEDHL